MSDPTGDGTGDGLPGTAPSAPPTQLARRSEQLARLLQRITELANTATATEEALTRAVRDVCETMGWPVGQALLRGDDGSLTPAGPAHVPDAAHRPIADRMRTGGPAAGGVPAEQSAADADAHWIPDVDADAGEQAVVAGWLAFPVVAENRVVAVLQFASDDRPDPAGDLLRTMTDVGRQLGVLIERNRAREELETLNRELERSNRELEQFASVASHDLQEPLRKIIGFADLLRDRHLDQLESEAAEFLGIVVDSAYRMRRLINDLLAYARTGRRRPELGPVALDGVVDDVLSDLDSSIRDTDASVTVRDPLPTVLGNPGELRELLVNLVGNALKYHGEEPPVVTISANRQDSGWWRLTVADDGIGIDPDHRERIFDVFQRLHGRDRYDGTGIGLAVCRRIAEHHGGRIWADASAAGGSAFHVTLPPSNEGPRSDD